MDKEQIIKQIDEKVKKQIEDGHVNLSEIEIHIDPKDKAELLFKGAKLKKHKGIVYH